MSFSPRWSNVFTIVELLIVIVVIVILAAISVVSYCGVQQRARDSSRSSDAASILKSLEAYKVINGSYPLATSTGGFGGYKASIGPSGVFMEYLVSEYFSSTPVDSINDSNHYHRYINYPAGSEGCPVERRTFYTFEIIGFENSANMPKSYDGLVCPTRTWWGTATRYFKYGFENG